MYKQKVCKNIDNVKVSSAVHQIDLYNVIHDSTDVADGEILLLLNDYGINHNWSDEELELLREHLLEMALQEELKVPMSNLSNHLNDLYRSGILIKEKQGNFAYYSLAEPDLINGINRMQKIFQTIFTNRNLSR